MKKFLLSLLMVLASVVSVMSQPSWSVIDRSTFKVAFEVDGDEHFGTAFCVPEKVSMLMTAAHVADHFPFVVRNYQGTQVPVQAVTYKDTKKDIATLMLAEPACNLSKNEWAVANESPTPNRRMTLFGYGTGRKVMTFGEIAAPPGNVDEFQPGGQMANLNALGGHSGGPVYNPEGKIVGMLVGSVQSHDVIDVIIPVEALRKVLK